MSARPPTSPCPTSSTRAHLKKEGNGASQTVLDWTLLVGAEGERRWADFTAPIASIAGQTGTLYVEQRDNGPGSHEQLYIDSIQIN